jgi:hypothetical protein
MSQTQKLIKRFLSNPTDLTWEELVKLLSYFGYKELKKGKTGGSRRKFADSTNDVISLHKPHPSNIVKHYVINDVVQKLKEKGKIKDD